MPTTRSLAVVFAVLSLLLPATAAAQSAGDNQYQDPLAGNRPAAKPQPSQTHSAAPRSSGSTSSSAPAAGSSAPAASSGAAPVAQAAPSAPVQLAQTGFDAWKFALAGFVLIVASVALGRSARTRRS